MKTLIERWNATTPAFFKKIIRIGVAVGVVGGMIATLPLSLPAFVVSAAGYASAVGTTAATIAKFAKVDVSDIIE
jgi:hypothetical protein